MRKYIRTRRVYVLLSLCVLTMLGMSCKRERINPLDPDNPNSNAVLLPPPTGLVATPDYGAVILTWNVVTGATRYRVFRDEEKTAEVDSTSYHDKGLTPDQGYKYQVSSVHSSGLAGHKSDPVYATTMKGPRVEYTRYEVVEDDNEDGIVNRGENIVMGVYLRNTGTEKAPRVEAYLTENDEFVTISADYGYYADLNAGEENSANYGFRVLDNCPYGHAVDFYLDISDKDANAWADTFTVTVQKTGANILFSKYEVHYDDNHDGEVDPGEYVELKIYLKNSGSSKAKRVEAYLGETDPFVVIQGDYGYYADLDASEEGFDIYSFRVDSACPHGRVIAFTLSINDLNGNYWSDAFDVQVK